MVILSTSFGVWDSPDGDTSNMSMVHTQRDYAPFEEKGGHWCPHCFRRGEFAWIRGFCIICKHGSNKMDSDVIEIMKIH